MDTEEGEGEGKDKSGAMMGEVANSSSSARHHL